MTDEDQPRRLKTGDQANPELVRALEALAKQDRGSSRIERIASKLGPLLDQPAPPILNAGRWGSLLVNNVVLVGAILGVAALGWWASQRDVANDEPEHAAAPAPTTPASLDAPPVAAAAPPVATPPVAAPSVAAPPFAASPVAAPPYAASPAAAPAPVSSSARVASSEAADRSPMGRSEPAALSGARSSAQRSDRAKAPPLAAGNERASSNVRPSTPLPALENPPVAALEPEAPAPAEAPAQAEAEPVPSENAAGRALERPAAAARRVDAPQRTEVELLLEARKAMPQQPSAALRLLDEHEARFAGGQLEPEREVLAIEALRELHRTKEAAARLQRFQARYPRSIHLRRLQARTRE